jgi:hypothetical protein
MQRRRWILAAMLSIPFAGWIASTPHAEASCVGVSVWVDNYQSPTTYLVGPGYCAVPTPFTQFADVNHDFQQPVTPLPPGTPNGAGEEVSVPSPVLSSPAMATAPRSEGQRRTAPPGPASRM